VIHRGTKLSDGTQLAYKCNGLRIMIATIVICYIASGPLKLFSPSIIYDHFWPLFTTVNIYAMTMTIYLYFRGFANGVRHHIRSL
jgi:hypothetical protein